MFRDFRAKLVSQTVPWQHPLIVKAYSQSTSTAEAEFTACFCNRTRVVMRRDLTMMCISVWPPQPAVDVWKTLSVKWGEGGALLKMDAFSQACQKMNIFFEVKIFPSRCGLKQWPSDVPFLKLHKTQQCLQQAATRRQLTDQSFLMCVSHGHCPAPLRNELHHSDGEKLNVSKD